MLMTIHCNECGNDLIKLDAISVNVELKKASHCETCYHTNQRTTHYFFCSKECFETYIKTGGKFEFKG